MAKDRNESDVAFIQALAELLREKDLTELEVEREYGDSDRLSVRVSRMTQQVVSHMAVQAAPQMVQQVAAPGTAQGTAPATDPARHPDALTSPMVGTCYLAPEPGSDPFVRVGDAVAEGQTVLIIEAMKTMNQIPAPRAGTVRRILVEDATPVEYGAPLLIIE